MNVADLQRRPGNTGPGASVTGLELPARLPPGPSSFDGSSRRLTEWLSALPLANIGETARSLFGALSEMNRTQMTALTRIKASEQVRHTVHYVSSNLDKHLIGTAQPISDKARKIASLQRELLSEIGTMYRIAVDDLLTARGGEVDRRLLSVAIHRALFYLGRHLLQSATLYLTPSTKLWREINLLYLLAEKNQVDAVAVRDPESDEAANLTVSAAYRRNLLFSLSDPYSMRQSETQTTGIRCGQWAGQAEMRGADAGSDHAKQTFVVDLWSDRPPRHASLAQIAPSRTLRYLDTAALSEALRTAFRETDPNTRSTATVEANRNILRRAIQRWGMGPRRQLTRTRMGLSLTVATSLSTIHRLVRKESRTAAPPPPPTPAPRQDSGSRLSTFGPASRPVGDAQRIESLFERDNAEPWRGVSFGELTAVPMDAQLGPMAAPAADPVFGAPPVLNQPTLPLNTTTEVPETYACNSLNESAGGYCLQWHVRNMPKVKIGELVGIQSQNSDAQFGVAVVRWLRVAGRSELRVGLQMIAPHAVAIMTQPSTANGAYDRSLLLPEMRVANRPASLITETIPYEVGTVVRVDRDGKFSYVRLTRLLESSGAFRQFQYVEVDEHESSGDDQTPDDDFTSLWSSL